MRLHPASKRRLAARMLCGSLVACTLFCGGLEAALGAAAQEAAPKTAFRKVLFLGNSITLHGPAPAIGWLGNWGMAASAADKDFVHLVTRALTESTGTAPEVMVRNIATFERQYDTCNVKEQWKEAFDFGADLVIVAIGENVPKLDSEEAEARFEKSVGQLLRDLKANGRPAIVVRSCFWPNRAKDEALKRACRDADGTFVDVGALAKDESNYARSEREFSHRGVAAHPGDLGMRAIADAILTGINNRAQKETRR